MSGAHRDALADGIGRVHAEAQGLLRLWFITPDDAAPLTAAALCGDEMATGLLRATVSCAAQVMKMRRKKPALCLCCPRPVRNLDDAVFAVAVPEAEHPGQALGSVICPRCAGTADLHSRAIKAYRDIWPDLREIEVMRGSEAVN